MMVGKDISSDPNAGCMVSMPDIARDGRTRSIVRTGEEGIKWGGYFRQNNQPEQRRGGENVQDRCEDQWRESHHV